MGEAPGGGVLLHVLAAGATGPEHIYSEIIESNHDLTCLFSLWHDLDQREGSMAGVIGVKGRKPHQAMDPCLTLKVAIAVAAFHLNRDAFNAGFLAWRDIYH